MTEEIGGGKQRIYFAHVETGVWCHDHNGQAYTFEQFMELARKFHGHPAPGLIIGASMVELARDYLDEGCVFDAICETRACLPDSIQMLTMCTIGNGWLKVIDSGRFAFTLYDKKSGQGVRVNLDSEQLEKHSTIKNWFFKLKPKAQQDRDPLYQEIKNAGDTLFRVMKVTVGPEYMLKARLGETGLCPSCGEPYPKKHGESCRYCQGERYFSHE